MVCINMGLISSHLLKRTKVNFYKVIKKPQNLGQYVLRKFWQQNLAFPLMNPSGNRNFAM